MREPLGFLTLDLKYSADAATTSHEPRDVLIAGRTLPLSPVFDTYWRFAAERQAVYHARQAGQPGPWTRDAILMRHRFTNCYRATDRVSQYLIQKVIYSGPQDVDNLVFRILLFKFFNKVSTWELLEDAAGPLTVETVDFSQLESVLATAHSHGRTLYSAAYVMPPPPLGRPRKFANHLRLLQLMLSDNVPVRLAEATSMLNAFEVLRGYPGIGNFLAYQFLIDINYSIALNFSENDFVVPGPGARDGIRKCFGVGASGVESEIIRFMVDSQDKEFARLGLDFQGLHGRELQLIDCQNLFCEVDKYARVAHPEVRGVSGRSRIKQTFVHDPSPLGAWFPPKWKIDWLT